MTITICGAPSAAAYWLPMMDATGVSIAVIHVVSMIAERQSIDFDKAYLNFLDSDTYAALQNPESLMWAESAEFIPDEREGK
ncbi:MAG: hypothetical protein LBE65_03755 [Synergistaceae bacterium]|jgi:hypothetical protein|nr:hypothetical protein [Synergistaceae bacterium]